MLGLCFSVKFIFVVPVFFKTMHFDFLNVMIIYLFSAIHLF